MRGPLHVLTCSALGGALAMAVLAVLAVLGVACSSSGGTSTDPCAVANPCSAHGCPAGQTCVTGYSHACGSYATCVAGQSPPPSPPPPLEAGTDCVASLAKRGACGDGMTCECSSSTCVLAKTRDEPCSQSAECTSGLACIRDAGLVVNECVPDATPTGTCRL